MSNRALAALAVSTCAMLAGSLASAHPLGNASTNHFVGLRIEPDEIAIHYVVDMAEISAFQEIVAATDGGASTLSEHDRQAYLTRATTRYLAGLRVTVDGNPIELRLVDASIETPSGVGGRPTLRVTSDVVGTIGSLRARARFAFEDTNHPGRAGWHEMVVTAGPGITVFDSNAFENGVSDELRHYPTDPLDAPLDERTAQWSAIAGPLPVGASPAARRGSAPSAATAVHTRRRDTLTSPDLPTATLWLNVVLAFVLGGLQSLACPGAAVPRAGSRDSAAAVVIHGTRAAVTALSALMPVAVITLIIATYVLPARWHLVAGAVASMLIGVLGLGLLLRRVGFVTPTKVRDSAAILATLAAVAVHHVVLGCWLLAAFGTGLLAAAMATATVERYRTPAAARRAALAHAWIVLGVGLALSVRALDVLSLPI
jgi:hypothetical protein